MSDLWYLRTDVLEAVYNSWLISLSILFLHHWSSLLLWNFNYVFVTPWCVSCTLLFSHFSCLYLSLGMICFCTLWSHNQIPCYTCYWVLIFSCCIFNSVIFIVHRVKFSGEFILSFLFFITSSSQMLVSKPANISIICRSISFFGYFSPLGFVL